MASPIKDMKTGSYSHSFENGYTPYRMTGHELPGIKQKGVPYTAGDPLNENMVDSVSQKTGLLYTEGGVSSSPAKGIFDSMKSIGRRAMNPLGVLKNALGGGGSDPAAQIKAKMEQMKAAVAAAKAGAAGAAGGVGGGIAAVSGGGEVPQHGDEAHGGGGAQKAVGGLNPSGSGKLNSMNFNPDMGAFPSGSI